jgi:hypothetical protein
VGPFYAISTISDPNISIITNCERAWRFPHEVTMVRVAGKRHLYVDMREMHDARYVMQTEQAARLGDTRPVTVKYVVERYDAAIRQHVLCGQQIV